jgi:DNA replication and repair protein RecF
MLSRLVLTDFRNHADLTLQPGAGFVVLTGANGAGKTNILEAVSLRHSARWRGRAVRAVSASRRRSAPPREVRLP